MLNPEVEINVAIPKPREMTEEDLERNKMVINNPTDYEDQPKQIEDLISELRDSPYPSTKR